MSTLQLLHISDLHITSKDAFDRRIVLEPLLARLKEDRENGLRPELVAVTGDIAYAGLADQYEPARLFFSDLLAALKLPPERLFLVPGNHDVWRKKFPKSSGMPVYANMKELNKELEDEGDRAHLLSGMDSYFSFVETHYPHLKSAYGRLVPFVHSYPAACGKRIGLVGLNSAWMCRKSPDEKQIAIGEFQVRMALDELPTRGEHELVLVLFHHPLTWLWPADRTICRTLLNDAVVLSGHLHEEAGGYVHDLEGRIHQFLAGAAYDGSQWPSGFQYLTFDWASGVIQLDYRKFVPEKRIWCVAAEKGKDGKGRFSMSGAGLGTEDESPAIALEIPVAYRQWLLDRCKHMDIDKLRDGTRVIQVRLPEIFIPLYADPPRREKDLEPSGERLRAEKDRARDIEELAAEQDFLLVEGQAGSGKTTLLKHLALTVANNTNPHGLNGYLPVLILLKDLTPLTDTDRVAGCRAGTKTAELLLGRYLAGIGNCLSMELVQAFCKAGRVIFLLDGLDEIGPDFREFVAQSFADLRVTCGTGNKMVLAGRPHGMGGAVGARFGERHVVIRDLTREQVELFITNWFRHVYGEDSRIGEKTGQEMISEIREHPGTGRLIVNPLMLTAVCILYHDGRELPGQRAELYKKFVNNLLSRRFEGSQKVHEFLMALAFAMQKLGVRGVDRAYAVTVLGSVYSREEGETEADYEPRLAALFDHIESNCGLLILEEGQYNFRHLTFQEYLTATYMVSKETDYAAAIRPYWDLDTYKEVIELYVGFLSIENKG